MSFSQKIWAGIWVVIAIAIIAAFFNGNQSSNNPTVNVKPNTSIQATTVQVAKFYNGQDGYSLSIPSGNTSTCTWTWAGGSADVPYSQTTTANSATEKHTITFDTGVIDSLYSFKVSCVDDFGNQYVGVFPTN